MRARLRRFLEFVCLAPLTLLPLGAARATVGGDQALALLGYEPVDGKVYYLVTGGGEAAELPRLHFLALRGDDPRAPQRVDSWYQGDLRAAEAAFPERLAKLKGRLTPVDASDLEGARLTLDLRDLRVCGDSPRQPRTAAEARARVAAWRAGEADPDFPVCRLVALDLTWDGFAGSAAVESWGSPALSAVYRLPDPRFALAVVRHVGQHFESGYAVDVPVLLRRDAAAAAEVDRAVPDPRCSQPAPAAGASTNPHLVKAGAWLPGWSPEWVEDAPWDTAEARRFAVGDVQHAALVVTDSDRVVFAVGRAAPGGGWCVLAVHEDAFGGNGVEGKLTEVVVEGDRAGLLFRHDRRSRGAAKTERAWSVLSLGPAGATWLARGQAWPAERVNLRWRDGAPAAFGAGPGPARPLPYPNP